MVTHPAWHRPGVLGARLSCWAAHVTWLAWRAWLLTASLAGSRVRLTGGFLPEGSQGLKAPPQLSRPSLQGHQGSLGKLQAAVFHPPGPSFPAARERGPRKTLYPWPQARPARPQLPGALSHCPHLGLLCAIQGTPRGCSARVSRRQAPVSPRAWHIGRYGSPSAHPPVSPIAWLRILSYDSCGAQLHPGPSVPHAPGSPAHTLPAVNPSSCFLPSSPLLSFLSDYSVPC